MYVSKASQHGLNLEQTQACEDNLTTLTSFLIEVWHCMALSKSTITRNSKV